MVAEQKPEQAPAERTLIITREFAAPRALVFSAWSRPEHLARWWGPKDFTMPSCAQDFRPGGAYRICMRAPGGEDHWVWGVYREIVAPERIVLTWHRDPVPGRPPVESLVTVTFAEHPQGTAFTLHQALFPTTQDRDEHQGGWGECLDRLAAYAARLARA